MYQVVSHDSGRDPPVVARQISKSASRRSAAARKSYKLSTASSDVAAAGRVNQFQGRKPLTQRLVECFYFICPKTSSDAMSDEGELEGDEWSVRMKPEAIHTLCQKTSFSKRELQAMYRGFKQDCPSGVIGEETFKAIYSQFFPRGADTHQYAHLVFRAFDEHQAGILTFTDLVLGLSALARGSLQEKLKWTFALYDVDGDGILSRDEIFRVISSVYDLLGHTGISGAAEDREVRRKADAIFEKLDANRDGVVTMSAFIDSCLRDENITRSLEHFNTVI